MDEDTFWHPGFLPVLYLDFQDYLPILHFEAEHHLTTKPLQIDVVVIKKEKNAVIDNPVGSLFRTYNLFEYKKVLPSACRLRILTRPSAMSCCIRLFIKWI
jgi:hypothetical protein